MSQNKTMVNTGQEIQPRLYLEIKNNMLIDDCLSTFKVNVKMF